MYLFVNSRTKLPSFSRPWMQESENDYDFHDKANFFMGPTLKAIIWP